MFRFYDLAYTSYNSCRKEFNSNLNSSSLSSSSSLNSNDQLINMNFHYAGALEMTSLANFMQLFANNETSLYSNSIGGDGNASMTTSNSSNSLASLVSPYKTQYNSQYIDEAIAILQNVCKNVYFSTRCGLLSTETLKATGIFLKVTLI
jgi:hypothetical protein